MSRGPGRIERAVEAALRDADRSYSIDELALIAYPGINRAEKKHRVAVLRTIDKIEDRMFLWIKRAYKPGGQFLTTNGSARSYGHGVLRQWTERSLAEIEVILADPEIKVMMEPGGLWWTDVEINKAERDQKQQIETLSASELADLSAYRHSLASRLDPNYGRGGCNFHPTISLGAICYLNGLLGRFAPPGSPVYEYAMSIRTSPHPVLDRGG